jgi:bifunctional aspartokinase / homoserine dehydrogenase 1
MPTHTMKFGGTSVGSPEALANVNQIVRADVTAGNRVAVVVSAMSGVTDMLIQSVKLAADGDKWGYRSLCEKMREKHHEAINRLMAATAEREAILKEIDKLIAQHQDLCDAVNILGDLTPRVMDQAVSSGERMSSRMIAAIMQAEGLNARQFDASQMLITDDSHQNAVPVWNVTEANIRQTLLPLLDEGVIPVITGFIGATPIGVFTTLGRGGSDYSAAIFAAYVDSDEFTIWTDVDGVMTTDPRMDKRARVLPSVSYTEVGEMAFYGAKVLHPKTVQPILKRGIPIRVRNTFNPDYPGTRITHEAQPSNTVIKSVASIRNVSLMTVTGAGMLGVPGIAGRAFLASAHAGANILMISQASSEQSFCFTVMDDHAQAVKNAVESELHSEIASQNVDGVAIQPDVGIVTVIGAGMRGTPGVAGRVFTIMGEQGINVLAIAQGASECSISFVLHEDDIQDAVVKLHDLALISA